MTHDREALLDDILAGALGLPRDALSPDLSGDTCAAWDSMTHIRIVLSLEERLGVRLGLDELETSMSRRALIDLLSVADREGRAPRGPRPTRP